jgi:hypothetical protein
MCNPCHNYMHITGYPVRHGDYLHFLWGKHLQCTFINFWNFFQGLRSYYGLKRLKLYYINLHILRGYVHCFCQIFQRLRLFKGLRLFRTLE